MPLRAPVTDIMTMDADVVKDTLPIREAARFLRRRRYGGVPVVSGSARLVGVLSYKDILDAFGMQAKDDVLHGDPLIRGYAEGDAHILDGSLAAIDHVSGLVRDFMSKDLIKVSIDDRILDAAKLMADKSVHRVLVVDGTGDLVGLVTTIDVVRLLVQTST
jgi:CBS domain-containing protein